MVTTTLAELGNGLLFVTSRMRKGRRGHFNLSIGNYAKFRLVQIFLRSIPTYLIRKSRIIRKQIENYILHYCQHESNILLFLFVIFYKYSSHMPRFSLFTTKNWRCEKKLNSLCNFNHIGFCNQITYAYHIKLNDLEC